MSITLKIILLTLGILSFIGCIFWWKKEGGWEPKVAILGALSAVIVLIFNLNQNEDNTTEKISIENNKSSPIANKIGTQNNTYYIQESPKENKNTKISESKATPDSSTKPKNKNLTFKGESPAEISAKIRNTEDLLKEEIAKSYKSAEIDWICDIRRIEKIDSQYVKVICNQKDLRYSFTPGIHIKLKLDDYPRLIRVKGGTGQELRVKGKIGKVSINGPIEINWTEVSFI